MRLLLLVFLCSALLLSIGCSEATSGSTGPAAQKATPALGTTPATGYEAVDEDAEWDEFDVEREYEN